MPIEYRAACHTCHATMRGPTPAALHRCRACGAPQNPGGLSGFYGFPTRAEVPKYRREQTPGLAEWRAGQGSRLRPEGVVLPAQE